MLVPFRLNLKRHLDFNDLYINPDDDIEEAQADCLDPKEQAAKRRRVEAIAAQYLRGNPPFILSATLRGPFNSGWTNPWTDNTRATSTNPERQTYTSGQRIARSVRKKIGAPRPVEAKLPKPPPSVQTKNKKRTASLSPETSRAVSDDSKIDIKDDSLDQIEVPPATAPSPEAPDASGGSIEDCISNRSTLTDPFWLRRPASQRQADASKTATTTADTSPTRTRSRDGRFTSRQGLRLAPAKVALHRRPSQPRAVTPEGWRSSASASMVFSSPVRVQDITPVHHDRPPSPVYNQSTLHDRKSSMRESASKNLNATRVEQGVDKNVQFLEPFVAVAECSHPNSPRAETLRRIGTSERASLQDLPRTGSQSQTTKEDIQRSAERLVDIMAASSGSLRQLEPSDHEATKRKTLKKNQKHDLVASPALSSSSGFVYRKLGEEKRRSSNATKSIPRASDVNSSPSGSKTPRKDVLSIHEELLPQPNDEQTATEDDIVRKSDSNDDLRSDITSQQSRFSTQAAMLLAQIEFHESPCSATSPVTPRPWLLPTDETPQLALLMPSPAITPLSVFNEQLEKSFTNDSVSRDPPISTQNLFSAASPFAFSTIKKRPEELQRHNLGFALFQNTDVNIRTKSTPLKSPAPAAERVPLKDKNVVTALWSFAGDGEKGRQASQDSLIAGLTRSMRDDEVPTSLGEFSLDSDTQFTNRFLHSLDSA